MPDLLDWRLETGDSGLVASRLRGFGEDIFLDLAQHRKESVAVQFEPGHVLLNAAGDLVEGDKERQLTLPQRVKKLRVIVSNPKNTDAIGHERHVAEVKVDVAVPAKVIPCPTDPLDGHAVVEQAAHDA